MTPARLSEQQRDRAWRGASGTGVGISWGSALFLLHVTDLGGSTLPYGLRRSKRCQEALLIWTDTLCMLLLTHTQQGAARELHGPSWDSPSTDSPSTLTTAETHIPLPAQRLSMEVSTVSSAPISPTEGDDPCEINTSDVAIHSVTLLICLCGLAGNGAVIWLLRPNVSTSSIIDVAIADFFFLLFAVPSTLLFLVEDVSCSTIMSRVYFSFLFQVSVVSYYWGLWLLTDTSMVMGIYKLCLLCCQCHLSWQRVWIMNKVQYCAFFTLIIVIPTVTSLCPSQEQEHCQVALISMFTIILLLLAGPGIIYRLTDFIKAKHGSKQQEAKKRDLVIFLIVLFTLLIIIWNFLRQLGYIVVSSQVFFLCNCINSTSKPFICFLVGRCWRNLSVGSLRESLQRVFEEQEDISAHKKDTTTDTAL